MHAPVTRRHQEHCIFYGAVLCFILARYLSLPNSSVRVLKLPECLVCLTLPLYLTLLDCIARLLSPQATTLSHAATLPHTASVCIGCHSISRYHSTSHCFCLHRLRGSSDPSRRISSVHGPHHSAGHLHSWLVQAMSGRAACREHRGIPMLLHSWCHHANAQRDGVIA